MHQTWVAVLLLAAAVRFPVSAQSRNYADARIVWDPSTLVLLQPGGAYGRMVRLPDRGILCAFEWSGAIYSRRSRDEGRTWVAPVKAASFDFGTPANPELLVLADGTEIE